MEREVILKAFADRWYFPILQELSEIEEEFSKVLELGEFEGVEMPEYAKESLLYALGGGLDASVGLTGLDDPGAKNVGATLGAKWVWCKGGSLLHRGWEAASARQRREFVEAFEKLLNSQFGKIEPDEGDFSFNDCLGWWEKCDRVYFPRLGRLRESALDLARNQGLFEDLQFLTGLTEGLRLPQKFHRFISKRGRVKTERRRQIAGYAFAMWPVIEASRHEIKWADLMEGYNAVSSERLQVDNLESFRRFLQLRGLRIGKPGRPAKKPEK